MFVSSDGCVMFMMSPVQPLVGLVQRGGQAAAPARVVPQGDHRCDVSLQQLAGEAAVVAEQGGVRMSHVSCGYQS